MNEKQLLWWLETQPPLGFIHKILKVNQNGVMPLLFEIKEGKKKKINKLLEAHYGVELTVQTGRNNSVITVNLHWWDVIKRITGIEPVKLCFNIKGWECKQ